ncbi:MAG: TetR/AcrR family transcriptional regulator [Myxococcota bacterium]
MAGRPRKASIETVLDRAMEVFWRLGYAEAAMSDLTEACGVGPSSLYRTFESKQELFRRAVERYAARDAAGLSALLETDDPHEMLGSMLDQAARSYVDPVLPRGCAVLSGRAADPDAARVLKDLREAFRTRVKDRIQQGVEAGQLRSDVDPEATSRVFLSLLQGLSNQAADGADSVSLLAMAQAARPWVDSLRQP